MMRIPRQRSRKSVRMKALRKRLSSGSEKGNVAAEETLEVLNHFYKTALAGFLKEQRGNRSVGGINENLMDQRQVLDDDAPTCEAKASLKDQRQLFEDDSATIEETQKSCAMKATE